MKIDLLTEPVPHEEARRFIAEKTPTSRAVFDGMLPELRGRAFVVSGIEDANLLQRFRDRIADLPQGGDWDAIRQEIAEDLVPFFVDPQAGGEEMQKQIEAAHRRAELLVRTHGFQAYAATRYRDQMANRDIHPWWQYKAFGDGRVRETHQALDGLVFPAGHDFWKDHYPPWDWGCRCIVIGLSPEVVDRMRAQDAGKAPDERRVIEGEVLERALETGRLQRGPNRAIDLRSPVERAEGAQARNVAYRWNPGELAPRLDTLRERYSPEVWAQFERWAKRTEIRPGLTVWAWAGAQAKGKAREVPTWAELAKRHGLDSPKTFTTEKAAALIQDLSRGHGIQAEEKFDLSGGAKAGTLSRQAMARDITDFLRLLPAGLVHKLPKVTVVLADLGGSVAGDYNRATRVLRMNAKMGLDAENVRTVLWHEMTHWVHDHGPTWYQRLIAKVYKSRTRGEAAVPVRGYTYPIRRDKWWWEYAGTQYSFRPEGEGTEVATTHVQLLSSPRELARQVRMYGRNVIDPLREILRVFLEEKP